MRSRSHEDALHYRRRRIDDGHDGRGAAVDNVDNVDGATTTQQPTVPLRTFTPEEIAAMTATQPEGPAPELT